MELCKGTLVAHPAKPDWGVGEVLQLDESHVRIYFESAGEKTLDLRYVCLEEVEGHAGRHTSHVEVLPKIDVEKVRAVCKLFIADLRDNRSTYNDASLAEHVLHHLERLGKLSKSTARQLAAWCTTKSPSEFRQLLRKVAILLPSVRVQGDKGQNSCDVSRPTRRNRRSQPSTGLQ